MKILMVCLGNICRSPMAEGVMRQKIKEANLDFEVDSAGTSDFHVGEAPDKRAISCMKKHGIDISDLKARQIKQHDFHDFDAVWRKLFFPLSFRNFFSLRNINLLVIFNDQAVFIVVYNGMCLVITSVNKIHDKPFMMCI